VLEQYAPGHYDFPFRYNSSEPATVALASRSCSCFQISVAFLTPAEALEKTPPVLSADRWHALDVDGKNPVPMPPSDPNAAPVQGLVRFSWVVKAAGPNRLVATLQFQAGPETQSVRLDVPMNVVPPVMVVPTTVQVSDLTQPGQQATAEAYCWSATRDAFGLTAPKPEDPRITVECQPLERAAKEALQKNLKGPPVQAGYRVRITVAERLRDGQAFDLGPFRRTVTLQPEGDLEPVAVEVTGVVRGAVRLSVNKDEDRINLGSFPRDRDKVVVTPLTADSPELTLKLMPLEPDKTIVRAELIKLPDEEGRPRWNLRIQVPKETLDGPLPTDSAITLESEAPGEGRRRMRIPLVGQATR
jgi:hypothetical protein